MSVAVEGPSSGPHFSVAIPARHGSRRLPGKPLRLIAGRPMIEHVHRRAVESGAHEVIIATDDTRVRDAAEAFGADVCMTSSAHPSGTDRLAEVARVRGWDADRIVVNLQGDEPLMDPELIRRVATDLAGHTDAGMTTVCSPIRTSGELFDPHVVKVVLDRNDYAMYFSRAVIPWDREAFASTTEELPPESEHYRHIGLYAYRAASLRRLSELEPCGLERTESLEQLRALWNGIRIHVTIVDEAVGHGVDTEEDLARVEEILTRC